jgi:hypothetical protein
MGGLPAWGFDGRVQTPHRKNVTLTKWNGFVNNARNWTPLSPHIWSKIAAGSGLS